MASKFFVAGGDGVVRHVFRSRTSEIFVLSGFYMGQQPFEVGFNDELSP